MRSLLFKKLQICQSDRKSGANEFVWWICYPPKFFENLKIFQLPRNKPFVSWKKICWNTNKEIRCNFKIRAELNNKCKNVGWNAFFQAVLPSSRVGLRVASAQKLVPANLWAWVDANGTFKKISSPHFQAGLRQFSGHSWKNKVWRVTWQQEQKMFDAKNKLVTLFSHFCCETF